jgi:gas vesicle protein
MDTTQSPSPLPVPDPSLTDLITGLEAQVISTLESRVQDLQSLQQGGQLDPFTFKSGVQQISGLVQASLLIHTLPSLLVAPPINGSLQTADLFKKIKQVADTVQELCRDQMRQAIANKATKILEQIHAKEQKIREQIDQKQQQVARIVQNKMTVH